MRSQKRRRSAEGPELGRAMRNTSAFMLVKGSVRRDTERKRELG